MRAVVNGSCNLCPIQLVKRSDEQLLLVRRQYSLARKHARMCVVNLDQGIEEVPLGVMEVRG